MAGQTYLQPPDIIDLLVRSRTSRQRPYPMLATPSSTERWRYPLPTLFARDIDLCSESHKMSFQHTSTAHLTFITRSSFHQTSQNTSQGGISPSTLGEALFRVPDHAKRYFADRALVAFERLEVKRSEAREIRSVFPQAWEEIRWCVWWWAGSEEKARMKMERLREAS
jgi:hypothetical protein